MILAIVVTWAVVIFALYFYITQERDHYTCAKELTIVTIIEVEYPSVKVKFNDGTTFTIKSRSVKLGDKLCIDRKAN